MRKTRSKFFAAALAATTMAAFYAAPVLAADPTGLTVNGEEITAATSVTINGVTLSRNNLTALGTITSQGKLTSNGGSTITATTAEKYQATSTVSANQISNTVKNYSTDTFINGTSSVITGTTITDTVYDAEGTMASKLALSRTSITGTVVGEEANSTITLNQTSASLKSGQKGFTVNDEGVITIAGTNFNVNSQGVTLNNSAGDNVFKVSNAGAITAAGKLTANGGSAITATNATTGAKATSNVLYSAISNTVDNGTTQSKTNVTASGITNSVKQYSENSIVNLSGTNRAQTATTITDTVYGDDNKAASTLTLNKTSATLKAGSASVGVNNSTGNVTITAKNSDGEGVFSVSSQNFDSSATTTTITAARNSSTATSSTGYSAITDTITNGTATATSKSTATAITEEVNLGTDAANIKTTLDKSGITDTFTAADGTTHKVVTNASGTTFTGDDGTYDKSVIDGQQATFGGSTTNQTAIDGGSATFTSASNNVTSINGGTATFKSAANDETTIDGGSITTNSLTLDDNNKWDEDGLTIGGTTLATNANGELVVSGLDVDNVYLESDGFKLGAEGSETFTVDTATGNVVTTGGITAASYNGVEISTEDEKVSVGGVDITAMDTNVVSLLSNTAGITRSGDDSSGYTTTIEGNTAISSDGMVISGDGTTSTKTKADGYYVKGVEEGSSVIKASLTSDTVTVGGQKVIEVTDKARVFADVYKISGENLAWTDTNGKVRVNSDVYQVDGKNFAWVDGESVNMLADRGTFGDTGSANTVVKGDGVYMKDGSTVTTSLTQGELNLGTNALTDEQLGYINGMVTGEGTLANVSSINGAAVAAVAATTAEGSEAGLQIAGVTLQDGNVTAKAITADSVNDVTIAKNGDNVEIGGVDITQMQDDVTQAGTDITALQQKTGGIVRRTSGEFSTTEIEGAAGVNNKSGFYVLGTDEEQTKVATISRDGDMTLAGNIRAEGNASIAGSFITENDNGKASLSSEALRLNKPDGDSSVNTVLINNDGTARFGALAGANVRIEDGVLTVNSESEKGETKISSAGIDAVGYVNAATYNDVTLAKDGDENILVGGINLTTIDKNTAGIVRTGDETNGYVTTIEGSTAISKDGVTISSDTNGSTIIDGGTITTGTTTITSDSITTDTLNVDKIVLGDKIIDETTGEEIGNLNIGADGSIKLTDGTNTFAADTNEFTATYGNYELAMDATNGFSLGYTDGATLTLSDAGYAFSGPLNLGADDSLISFTHTHANDNVGRISLAGTNGSLTLQTLVDKVEELDYRTQGISYKDGSTTITSGNSTLTVDANGTTFANGTDNGTTNIDGGTINADRSEIGNIAGDSSTGGSGTSGSGDAVTGNGTITDETAHQGHYTNDDGEFAFQADADGYTSVAKQGDNIAITGNTAEYNNSYLTNGSSSSLREQTATDITNSVTEDDKENSFTQTVDSTVSNVADGTNTNTLTQTATTTTSSITDGTNTNTLTQSATETANSISDGTNTYSSSQTATGSVTKVSDGTNSSTFEQSATGHKITTKGEDGNEYTSVVTGQDVVINQGTESEVSLAKTENRVTNLEGEVADLNRRVDKLDDRIDKVGAMAAAIANLRTMGYDPTAPTEFAIGIGQYRSDTGVALGLFHYPNRDFMLSLSVSTSGDEVMGGIGATWKFGRKKQPVDQAKVNKAEELKLAAQKKK